MSEKKEYSLKSIESQLINIITQQQSTLLSNVLSFIALERLAVQVTPETRFELSQDFKKLFISQDAPEAEVVEPGVIEQVPAKEKK